MAVVDGKSNSIKRKLTIKSVKKKPTLKGKSLSERLGSFSKIVFGSDTQIYDDLMERCYYMESAWTDIIDHKRMSAKTKVQQQAVWEFLKTERNYIIKLRVIVQVFQQCFKLAQSEEELLYIKQSELFSNINEIFLANDEYWHKHLLKNLLNKTRQDKQPIKPAQLFASFTQLENIFKPYKTFFLHQDACLQTLRNCMEENEVNKKFNEYLNWCENLPQCQRFKLRDLLTEPMQRMTRYPLLLKKIRKETEDEDEKNKLDLTIKKIESLITNINTDLRKRFENEKLEKCLEQFEYYNSLQVLNEEVKWISVDFLRMNIQGLQVDEQRCILKRGPMKLVEKKHETIIEVLLFTDVIVMAKLKKNINKLRVIRQLFYLDKINLIKSEASNNSIVFVYLDEFGMLATGLMLEVGEGERETWIATIERAKTRYMNARAGHGSTLDFFQDDYNITSAIALQDSQARIRTEVQYKSTFEVNDTNMLTTSLITPSNVPLTTPSKVTPSKVTPSMPSNDRTGNFGSTPISKKEEPNKFAFMGYPPNNSEQNYLSNYLPASTPAQQNTASWVLTNEKRSGSISSDLSNESLHLVDSFRSNKSGSSIRTKSSEKISIRTSQSVPSNIEGLIGQSGVKKKISTRSLSQQRHLPIEKRSIDRNNNHTGNTTIRGLIYGKLIQNTDSTGKYFEPRMQYFVTTSTQTENSNNDNVQLPLATYKNGATSGLKLETFVNSIIKGAKSQLELENSIETDTLTLPVDKGVQYDEFMKKYVNTEETGTQTNLYHTKCEITQTDITFSTHSPTPYGYVMAHV